MADIKDEVTKKLAELQAAGACKELLADTKKWLEAIPVKKQEKK